MFETILITGGTGKVGSQLLQHFYSKNFNVIFTALTSDEANKTIDKIKQPNKKNLIKSIIVDLMQEDSHRQITTNLEQLKIFPEFLINCARSLSFLKVNDDGITMRPEWLGEFTLDVVVPYELSMALANHKKTNLKSIIIISSIYGIVPFNPNLYINPQKDSPIQYSIAKSAQIQLTKELAIRLASQNISVNAVSFGGIEGRVDEEFKRRYAQLCPIKRMLKIEEITPAVDFLICSHTQTITGHNLVADGGWSIW